MFQKVFLQEREIILIRGQVKILPSAENSQNFTQCDSLLIGDQCGAITVPYIEVKNPTAKLEHEASTSKVSDEQLFYLMQRGLTKKRHTT